MDKCFESELKGNLDQARNAKRQIEKYFKRYGESGHQDAKKHQLAFASRVVFTITKCSDAHLDIYCNIITHTFGDQLKPEFSPKYWAIYVNYIRFFHYHLVAKKEFEKAAAIYNCISSYENKLQSAEIGIILVNIYCYQLYLQNSLRSSNMEKAVHDANEILENLTKLFKEILETNKQSNFQYPDILNKSVQSLFPQNNTATIYQFLNILSADKVKRMFDSLFAVYGRQTITVSPQENLQDHVQFIMETLYTFIQVDIMDKLRLQLTVSLLGHCRTECRLQSDKPIAELFGLLYDYLKLICASKPTLNFQHIFSLRCERFKELFRLYSKTFVRHRWFGDLLVFLYYLHSHLQNIQIFSCFWKQMFNMECYKALFELFIECMKLAPCISRETKLFSTSCCTSIRKHIILSFAQISMMGFVFYCQNVDPEDEKEEQLTNNENTLTDSYTESIHKNLLVIISHIFKVIDKMDCITSSSQEILVLLGRFKQATLSVKTSRQAGTCLSIAELFLKITTVIPRNEWPLLLRRLYKTVTQHNVNSSLQMGRDLQMCYITSMLDNSIEHIDIGQIRTQISIYYDVGSTTKTNELQPQQEQPRPENCLMHCYLTTKSIFRPYLDSTRKRLLHWFESQHILKYYKTNTPLLHSLLKSSQSKYDFVIITRKCELETYALAKISSLYTAFSTKAKQSGALNRLEQLTYGHVCLTLLQDQFTNQNFSVETKELNEDLEQLLLRKEMESFTITNELKRLKLALQAFKAFEDFYEKFDTEIISMDDAIIDWESIINDLTFLAQYLQLSGFMEYSLQVWLLQYKCSRLIQDNLSALRSLAFFCEYSEFIEKNTASTINIDYEIELSFPTITVALENLSALSKGNTSSVLLAVLQIAYYYARSSRYTFAQMLMLYVEQKHFELPERQDRYDLIMATIDFIKFRLMWKHFKDNTTADGEKTNPLLRQCLLHEIIEILERFHKFNFIASSDGLMFSILIVNMVQEFAECSVNRLSDNLISALVVVTCKSALRYGLALRFVQVMSMWMWVNLQMEYVDIAQTQLKIIEFVMGGRSIKELTENCAKAMVDIQSSTLISTNSTDLISMSHNPGMEATRKLVQLQLSPIRTKKLAINPSSRNLDLNRYIKSNIDTELMPQNEQLEWTYFTVGCLIARLYFLVEDYDQLEKFYENGSKWLQMRNNSFNKQYYQNIQLMSIQHYVNFLRSQRKYDKALQCLEYALELCEAMKFKIDIVYYYNFQLQLHSTRKELEGINPVKHTVHQNLRRALEFHELPEHNNELREKTKKDLKEKMSEKAMASNKKIAYTTSLKTVVSGCTSSSRKPKTLTSCSSSGSSSSLDMKSIKPKNKPKFEICEDSVEIINLDDSIEEIVPNPEGAPELKIAKTTKTIEINEKHKTPKIPRTITKPIKTTSTTTAVPTKKFKRPQPETSIDFNLSDCPLASSTSSSISSLDQLEAKECISTNVIISQMNNLVIDVLKKPPTGTKPKSRGRKQTPVKESSASIVILVDSPSPNPVQDDVAMSKTTKTRNKDKTPNAQRPETAASIRPRRYPKRIMENHESASSLSVAIASSSSSIQRKKI